MPPPRVYMHVSRSGQTRRPCSQMSSPTLTTAVISDPGPSAALRPIRKRAPPTPPTRTVTFTGASLRRSNGAVVLRGEPRPEPRPAKARHLDIAHGPLPLRRVGREDREHSGVVERAAQQRPADD